MKWASGLKTFVYDQIFLHHWFAEGVVVDVFLSRALLVLCATRSYYQILYLL